MPPCTYRVTRTLRRPISVDFGPNNLSISPNLATLLLPTANNTENTFINLHMKIKLSLSAPWWHIGRVVVYLTSFVTSVPDQRSPSQSGRFTLAKHPRYQLSKTLVGPQSPSGRCPDSKSVGWSPYLSRLPTTQYRPMQHNRQISAFLDLQASVTKTRQAM
jgi:hypothetical protein